MNSGLLRKINMWKTHILKTHFLLILAVVFGLATAWVLADLTPIQVENGKKATALVHIIKIKSLSPGRGFGGMSPGTGLPGMSPGTGLPGMSPGTGLPGTSPGRGLPGTTSPGRGLPGTSRPGTKSTVNGTAFCIDAAGWFVTCKHVTDEASDGKVSLILNAGEKNQTILEAKIVRGDEANDLALLKVTEGGPYVALPLGKVSGLMETARLTAFGYPFGESLALAEGTYPAISVSPGAITSLRKKDGKLEMIQLDASLNPGNSGGPVLDSDGRVVGIVNAGIEGASVNFAIPVSHLQEFLSVPDVDFIPPALNAENMSKSVTFRAKVLNVMGGDEDYQVELTITTAGVQRKVTMKRGADGYSAEEVPVPPRKGPMQLSLSASYGQNSVSGMIVDKSFTVGGKTYQLSKVQSMEGGSKPSVVMDDGKTIEGAISGLSSVTVILNEMQVTVDLTKATSVTLHPLGTVDSVEYQLVISKNDKSVKTVSGVIPIGNAVAPATKITPVIAASSGPGTKITPPAPGALQPEVKLPSDIADVAVGGGGRFLIMHLRKLHQLAIFDASVAKVVKYLTVDSDDILFTAGTEKLLVVSVAQNIISRYNLKTFEREVTVPMPVKGTIKAIAMGANSQGPLLVVGGAGTEPPFSHQVTYSLVDPNTLALKNTLSKINSQFQTLSDTFQIRASADGTVFGMWRIGISPSGLMTMIIEGNDAQTNYAHESVGSVIPGPDGRIIYTSSGLYTTEAKMIGSGNTYARNSFRIPATQGNYYLEIDGEGKIAVCLAGESRTLVTLPNVGDFFIQDRSSIMSIMNQRNNVFFSQDKHIHFVPDAHLIVAIPKSNDRLILQQFDLLQAMKNSNIDYFFVASSPITSTAKNSSYVYQIQVESKRGGVAFSLESGPTGMKISPTGKLTWTAGATESEVSVIVRITDASGQETFHAFKISVK
jgi:S1-C subfamily serine protease